MRGAVLTALDRLLRAKGVGSVYVPNPVAAGGALSQVPLLDLHESGYLEGRVTRVIDRRAVGAFDPFGDGPGLDGDAVCDAGDIDRDNDGCTNDEECRAARGQPDLVAINLAIFDPARVTALCDANGDGACNVGDIIAANAEIFSTGSSSTCPRQPFPGP